MITVPFDFVRYDVALAPMTYYRVGGPARILLQPHTAEEAVAAWVWMLEQDVPRLVLGGGSNMLIHDTGFPGIVLCTDALCGVADLGDNQYAVMAGELLDRLVRNIMLLNNYKGVGGLSGIPGSVGGAIFMNAGTVNGSICDLLESVDLADAQGVNTIHIEPDSYGYRHQRFCPPDSLIVSARFQFAYAEEDQYAVYDHYIKRRKMKQPRGYCCGSVFKNPDGGHAGQLIEACGLKGERWGGAIISPQHANFIMNENHATFDDIISLISLCKQRVAEQFGVELEEEVRIIRGSDKTDTGQSI